MRINANIGQQNIGLNVARINQSVAKDNTVSPMGNRIERKDTASISGKGKATSLLESLMNQKQQIIENKNKLIDRTLERGGSMTELKSQLESYDEQLKEIDNQISKAMTEDSTQTEKKEEKLESYKPKTKAEVQTETMNSIINISSDIKNTEIIDSVKTAVEGEIKVVESEIKLTIGSASDKLEELSNLKGKASELSSQVGEELLEITEDINKPVASRPEVLEEETTDSADNSTEKSIQGDAELEAEKQITAF